MGPRRPGGVRLLHLGAALAIIALGLALEMKLRDVIWPPAVALQR